MIRVMILFIEKPLSGFQSGKALETVLYLFQ